MAEEQVANPANPSNTSEKTVDNGDDTKIAEYLQTRVLASKRKRKDYYNEWKRNTELRLGKIASQFTGGVTVQDEVQTEINPDWYLSKTKTANLFSQVPEVRGTHENMQYAGAVQPFLKELNFQLSEKRTNIGAAIEENLNDVVNASGIGGMFISWSARFEDREVPKQDLSHLAPDQVKQMITAKQVEMDNQPVVTDGRFNAMRISPIDLIWPAEFAGSDFNAADYGGYSGRLPWGVAKRELRLTEEEKRQVLGTIYPVYEESLESQPDKGGLAAAEVVKFDDIYYWRHRVDPECKSFDEIWRLVYVQGLDKPKIHEPYQSQKLNEKTGKYIGVRRLPVQILTITYISDNAVPPSDSSAARPQVNDMRRSRAQLFQQRERSIPVRWYNTNAVDPLVANTLMRGTWQGMIPTNGDGSRSIGEIARASYPSEDMAFDTLNKKDLMEMWQIGPEQIGGTQTRQNKAQTAATQSGFATRIGQERNRVAAYFIACCEVLSGLIVMHGSFDSLTDQQKQQMQQSWNIQEVAADLVLKILPDSQIVLDSNQRMDRLSKFLNLTVKSGFVNPEPIIAEMAELAGLDPMGIMVKPQPKQPDEPNVSMRFTGKDDLMNPMVVAMLIAGHRAPTPEQLEQARKLLESLQQPTPLPGPNQPQPPGGSDQKPGGPPGSPPPGPGRPPGPPANPALQGGPGEHPEWSLASKIAKRDREIGGG